MSVIDFHCHILPGIDDGSESAEMTAEMLHESARQGVDLMVATPHFYAEEMSLEDFLTNRSAANEQLQAVRKSTDPEVICGAEVAFFYGMGHANALPWLCIEGTNLLLLEMPFCQWNARVLHEVDSICRTGITPIIAHIERFYAYQKDRGVIPALLELPVLVQVNAECLTSWSGRRKMLSLFREGLVQLLGSDCHNMKNRPPNLKLGRDAIKGRLGAGYLNQMDMLGEELLGL